MIDHPVVQLWGDWRDSSSYLILERPGSGCWYSNQVGGTACDHPEVEGILIPIARPFECEAIYDHWPVDSCPPEIIELVKASLREFAEESEYTLELDPTRPIAEAWVPVILRGVPDVEGDEIQCLLGSRGYLTYPNSD